MIDLNAGMKAACSRAGVMIAASLSVKANLTIDTNIAYAFNKQAPFYNSADGYDAYIANVLGRVASG